jgi:tetratricopeptide (TPR) repeat protein
MGNSKSFSNFMKTGRQLINMPTRAPSSVDNRGALTVAETPAARLLGESDQRLASAPGSFAARVNRGYALYQMSRHEEALGDFQKAYALARDSGQRALARYNEGNALFMLQRLEPALQAYRLGLMQNPADDDLRYNFIVTKRLLEAGKSAKQQDKKPQDGEGSPSGRPPEKKPEPSGAQEGQKEPKPDSGSDPSVDKQGTPLTPNGAISREDALRLLQAIADRERQLKPAQPAKIRGVRKEKDW